MGLLGEAVTHTITAILTMGTATAMGTAIHTVTMGTVMDIPTGLLEEAWTLTWEASTDCWTVNGICDFQQTFDYFENETHCYASFLKSLSRNDLTAI